ncbi:MAG: GNAT family N-acetyltransferase [Methanomassiliicoccales archaeon]|nr:GNAT family N-acetyltransferase [Methanomassiliicoccales archaeon]
MLVRQMRPDDLEQVRDVGQKAWSDVASSELGRKVKYPYRPRKIINGYLWKEPRGCLVVEDGGQVIASAHCHVWGKVGWFGPFEVLPEMQGRGVGKALLGGCEDYLIRSGCVHLGLETMPYIAKNVHFYLRAGYRPEQFTSIMRKDIVRAPQPPQGVELMGPDDLPIVLPAVSALSRLYHPDLDLAREVEMTIRQDLGSLFVTRSQGRIAGFGLLHAFHPIEESDHSAVRLLLVDPRHPDAPDHFSQLMLALEDHSYRLGRRRMFARFTVSPSLYQDMLDRQFVLEGSNMRMLKGPGYSERKGYIMAAWAG